MSVFLRRGLVGFLSCLLSLRHLLIPSCFQRRTDYSALYCSLPQLFQVMDSLTFLQGKKKKNHTVLYNVILL